jgi:hypothetical protein
VNRRGAAALAVGAAVVAGVLRARRRAAAGVAGALGEQLAAWVPSAPGGRLARAAALVWAAPITLLGLVAGFGSGARARATSGVLLFAPARGVTGWLLRRRGFAAVGLGHVVVSVDEPSPGLLAHELAHVRQAERLGPFMAPAYLAFTAVHGYHRNPLERAARLAAARAAGASTPP